MAGRHRVRRSESFTVRRWLHMSAASAGMGAALWGMTLVGPQIDVAMADDGGSASPSSDAGSSTGDTKSDRSTSYQRSERATARAGTTSADAGDDSASADRDQQSASNDSSDGSDDNDDSDDNSTANTDGNDDQTDDAARPEGTETAGTVTSAKARDRVSTYTASIDSAVATLDPGPSSQATTTESIDNEQDSLPAAAAPAGDPWGMEQAAGEVRPWQSSTGDIITGTTTSLELLINTLPVPPELRDALTGTLWTMRRTFFNLAPVMNAEYSVTSGLGPIVGRAAATDPEGDQIYYRVAQGPKFGTVTLNADGSFTYTPTTEFDGVDTFVLEATDPGLHVNLLDPFRAAGASASLLVNQNAIDFEFIYTDPDGYFTDAAKQALYESSKRLAAYFIVKQKTVLTYTINSEYLPGSYLASADSDLASTDPGFWGTVVQEKLLTGIDANGEAADGEIDWNWAYNWGFYPTVPADSYDFTSTVMHELLHSFGWNIKITNPIETNRTAWFLYDQLVTTRQGVSPINAETHLWDSAYDPYLTGFDGGMFFFGAHAMAAYGGRPVPLYTPTRWAEGSSIGHLDDNTFSGPNHMMMDHAALGMGPDNIALSPVELGVLMDLGFTVVTNPWFTYPQPPHRPSAL